MLLFPAPGEALLNPESGKGQNCIKQVERCRNVSPETWR